MRNWQLIVNCKLGIGNLRIIADDLGFAKSVNDGIILLLKEGKISGASLMANGEAFDDAVAKYDRDVRNDGDDRDDPTAQSSYLGIHFVLVEGKSLSGIKLSTNHKYFFIKYILGLIKLSDIEKELRAQLEKIMNAGIRPDFINSHQHLHLIPGIMSIVIKLAKENNIPDIRVVNEPVSLAKGKLFRQAQLLFLNFLSKLAKKKIKKAGLVCNDFFVGFVNAGNLSENDIKNAENLTQKYPDKIIELGCHPGYENEELRNRYKHWGDYNWEKEIRVIKKRG